MLPDAGEQEIVVRGDVVHDFALFGVKAPVLRLTSVTSNSAILRQLTT